MSLLLRKGLRSVIACTVWLVLAAAVVWPASGQVVALREPDPIVENPTITLGDQLESLGRVYQDKSNPVLQEFWLLGRYHGQYHWSDGSNGSDESYETRRFRVGFQARMFEKMVLHAQMVSGSDFEPFYNGFTELWARWEFSDALELTVGQQKHRFTHDRNVSSRYINYLERAQLTNMFRADYTPAVTLSGEKGPVTYYTGIFSNATGRDMVASFSEFNSGYSLLGAIYYDLADKLGTDHAHLHFTALQSDATDDATNLNRFDQGLSSALILTEGPVSLVTEVTGGLGSERGDAVGINIQPAVFLTDTLQLALRYQLAGSNDPQGLEPQRRYEAPAGLPAGDLYQAGYAGLNYYIAKHRLKIMTGVEYATMGGEDVWTASTMFRFYFGPHSGGAFPMNQMLKGALGYGHHDFLGHD